MKKFKSSTLALPNDPNTLSNQVKHSMSRHPTTGQAPQASLRQVVAGHEGDKLSRISGTRAWAKAMQVSLLAATLGIGSLLSIHSAQAEGLSDLFANKAPSSQGDFLKVEDAFTVVPMQKGDQLTVSIEITPEHYVYKDKLSVKLPQGVTASPFKFSQPSRSIDDPNFGRVAIFDQDQVTATATLTNTTGKSIDQNITLTWQGCAKAGLCYPPQRQTVTINLPNASSKSGETNKSTEQAKPNQNKPAEPSKAEQTDNSSSKTDLKKESDSGNSNNSNSNNNPNGNETKGATKQPVTSQVAITQETQSPNTEATLQDANSNSAVAINGSVESASELNDEVMGDESGLMPISNLDSGNGDAINATDSAAPDGMGNVDAGENTLNPSTAIASSDVVNQDPFGLAKHPWLAMGLLFLAGLGLAFTPCVLPMLPIVSNIVARQHTPSAKGGLILSGSYALGVATAYGVLGAIIAIFGQSLGIIGWLQNPVILISFAIIFVLLALYMLDAFRFPVPSTIKRKMQAVSEKGDNYLGSTAGSFIAGFLSALVVSPCVSAPLFGALLAVSTIGNPLLGFFALFMLGFGLSAPLMLLGASQGNLMPKAGAWMDWVKQGFAMLLFAVALLLISRVLLSPAMLVLWAIWFMATAVWAWSWTGRGRLLTRPVAILLGLWSALVLAGAAAGSTEAWQPLSIFAKQSSNSQTLGQTVSETSNQANDQITSLGGMASSDIRITSIGELEPLIKKHNKVLVDVTAEWCVECRIMDKTLFANRPSELEDWQVVKLDITESNEDSKQVLSTLRLFGPPALLYFVDGELKSQQVGTVGREEFEATLAQF